MAAASDFKKLGGIKGVAHYILVQNDGHIVAHNTINAAGLASTIVISGKNSKKLEKFLDSGKWIYFSVERNGGGNLLVFSLGNYFLGIIEKHDSDTKTMVDSIISYLKTLLKT